MISAGAWGIGEIQNLSTLCPLLYAFWILSPVSFSIKSRFSGSLLLTCFFMGLVQI